MQRILIINDSGMNTREIRNLSDSIKLSEEQRAIIVGLMLGDGHLATQNKGRTYRLLVEHSLSQGEYVDWLYQRFDRMVLTGPHHKTQIVKGEEYSKYYFTTVSTPALRFYGKLFYPQGKKVVPDIIAKLLTPLSLAIWFMDDGSCKSKFHRARIINTQGFALHDILKLQDALERKFGIKTTQRKQKEGMQLYIPSTEIERFFSLISPYILPSMEYKIRLTPLHKL